MSEHYGLLIRTLRRPQRDCIRFFLKETTGTTAGRTRIIKSIIGELPVSEKQARKLKLDANQKISPYLEECCLRASANLPTTIYTNIVLFTSFAPIFVDVL
jgi:hypothetical protein